MSVFAHNTTPHARHHGPGGYTDYGSYKEWLRDDFCFTCVYCRERERWNGSGQEAFSVEHVEPKSAVPERETDYENLVYACTRCNARKGYRRDLPDPCTVGLGTLLSMDPEGVFVSELTAGLHLIKILKLNEPRLVARRRALQAMHAQWSADPAANADQLRHWFGFPEDLPNLAALRPTTNSRPAGTEVCWFALRSRGQLPPTY